MHQRHLLAFTSLFCLSTALIGCGGTQEDEGTPIERQTLSGKVIDGYIENAKVYIDYNLNGELDAGDF